MKRAALIFAALAAILTAAAAPVRTATENFVTNKIAAAATLTPIYSSTPTFGEWVCQPDIVTVYWDDFRNMWQTDPLEGTNISMEAYNPNATNIVFILESEHGEVTATRTRTDIIGYTLGDQSDKPLQPKGDYALRSDIPPAVSNTVTKAYVESLGITSEETDPTVPQWAKAQTKPTYTASEVGATTPEDVTAAIREQSLGGIWDETLRVWWTPVMRNGSLTYQATTNVNLNAEN